MVKEEVFPCTGKLPLRRDQEVPKGRACKAGTQKAEYREGCTSQPITSSQTLALIRWWTWGAEKKFMLSETISVSNNF